VVNLLYVDVPAAEKQILLKVRFASVDRSKAQQMGINLFNLGLGNAVGGITTGQFTPPTISGGSSSSSGVSSGGNTATFSNEMNLLAFFPGLKTGADIQAIETKGVVETLAEPNVIAANGKQASFLAGGEYPFPVAQGGSSGSGPTITIMFKEYGVRLNFIPTITPRGTIRLQVAPEVSALDFTNAVTISGFRVPAITSRKVKTEAELADGQSFVIGGLLDNRETQTFMKIPFLGDIPILGKFFQSSDKNRTNTELIVIVTPQIINPIPAGAPLPELKFPEKFLPANSSIPMRATDQKPADNAGAPVESMPVERLIESKKPEKPLVIEGGMSPSSSQ
jgi:pilus assembly protein CpaC